MILEQADTTRRDAIVGAMVSRMATQPTEKIRHRDIALDSHLPEEVVRGYFPQISDLTLATLRHCEAELGVSIPHRFPDLLSGAAAQFRRSAERPEEAAARQAPVRPQMLVEFTEPLRSAVRELLAGEAGHVGRSRLDLDRAAAVITFVASPACWSGLRKLGLEHREMAGLVTWLLETMHRALPAGPVDADAGNASRLTGVRGRLLATPANPRDTRERALVAAVARLAKDPWRLPTHAELQQDTGISERTLWRRFPTRDALRAAISNWYTEQVACPHELTDVWDLIAWMPQHFARMDANPQVALSMIGTRSAWEIRLAGRDQRFAEMERLLAPHLEGAGLSTHRAEAVVRLAYVLRALRAWTVLCGTFGMPGTEAGHAVGWALACMVRRLDADPGSLAAAFAVTEGAASVDELRHRVLAPLRAARGDLEAQGPQLEALAGRDPVDDARLRLEAAVEALEELVRGAAAGADRRRRAEWAGDPD
ncbi:MAG: hypothetical protein U0Y82_00870 [Thermoleophilia bacterium]